MTKRAGTSKVADSDDELRFNPLGLRSAQARQRRAAGGESGKARSMSAVQPDLV
jgi:hypothetical protein